MDLNAWENHMVETVEEPEIWCLWVVVCFFKADFC